MRKRTIALIVLGLIAVAVVVPVRPGTSDVVTLSQTAGVEGECGSVEAGGDLHVRRYVPLIDAGAFTVLDVTFDRVNVSLTAAGDCSDVDELAGGVLIAHTRCAHPAVLTESEQAEWESSLSAEAPNAELAVRCGGAAFTMVSRTGEGMPLEASGDWQTTIPLGRTGIVTAEQWCLASEYWIDVIDDGGLTSQNAVPVDGDLCVSTRGH